MELLAVIGVAVLLFVATNIDDIFVLVAFFANPSYGARPVVIGQFLGIGVLTALSVVGSLLALVVEPEYMGLLGVLPFLLGAGMLVQLLRGDDDDDDEDDEVAAASSKHTRIITVALVTIANGGDNVGAYVPVFATLTPLELGATIAVFVVMTALCCWAAHALVSHPKLGPTIRRVARPITPFVLMAIGVLVVIEAGTYRLFG